jgi:hypothetical protein
MIWKHGSVQDYSEWNRSQAQMVTDPMILLADNPQNEKNNRNVD